MDLVHLFAATLDDLERLVAPEEPAEYDMLRASALLRKLLIDSNPLAHQVNRDIRMQIRFRVSGVHAGTPIDLGIKPISRFASVNPYGARVDELLSMKGFLARPVIWIDDRLYTVRNVIKCVAHVQGGVHYFDPEDDEEAQLMSYDESIRIGDISMLHRHLIDIGKVTVEGLTPLREAARMRP